MRQVRGSDGSCACFLDATRELLFICTELSAFTPKFSRFGDPSQIVASDTENSSIVCVIAYGDGMG